MDAFAATRLAVGAGVLVAASAWDLRARRVRNETWILLGSLGTVIIAAELAFRDGPVAAWCLLGSGAIAFYGLFYGEPIFDDDGFRMRPVRIAGLLLASGLFVIALQLIATASPPVTPGTIELASMPVMIVLYQVFYRVRLLHGGADAKALIALTLLVPTYPDVDPLPLLALDPRVDSAVHAAFPFSLVVWVNAAILSLAVPVALLIYNAGRGDLRLPQALLGYRAPLDPLPRHAWPMEKIAEDGEHVLVLFPRRGADARQQVDRLRAAGVDRAWVQFQIPFMVPLLAGFLMAFLLGNVLIGVLGLGAR